LGRVGTPYLDWDTVIDAMRTQRDGEGGCRVIGRRCPINPVERVVRPRRCRRRWLRGLIPNHFDKTITKNLDRFSILAGVLTAESAWSLPFDDT